MRGLMTRARLAAALEIKATHSRRVGHALLWLGIVGEGLSAISFLWSRQYLAAQLPVVLMVGFGAAHFALSIVSERHAAAREWTAERLREQKADATASEQRAAMMAAQVELVKRIDPTRSGASLTLEGVGVPITGHKH